MNKLLKEYNMASVDEMIDFISSKSDLTVELTKATLRRLGSLTSTYNARLILTMIESTCLDSEVGKIFNELASQDDETTIGLLNYMKSLRFCGTVDMDTFNNIIRFYSIMNAHEVKVEQNVTASSKRYDNITALMYLIKTTNVDIEKLKWFAGTWHENIDINVIILGINAEFGFIKNSLDFSEKMSILGDLYNLDTLNSCVGCEKRENCKAQYSVEDAESCILLEEEDAIIEQVERISDFIDFYSTRLEEYNQMTEEMILEKVTVHKVEDENADKVVDKVVSDYEKVYEEYKKLEVESKVLFLEQIVNELANA